MGDLANFILASEIGAHWLGYFLVRGPGGGLLGCLISALRWWRVES